MNQETVSLIKKPLSKKRKIIYGSIIVVGVLCIILSNAGSPSSTQTASVKTEDRKYMSIAFAENVIKQILKSPSTADFSNEQAYELTNEKDVWAVNGYVDSQNSFGAMLRSTWEVDLDYSDGKGGTVKSVMFDGKKIQ